MQDDATIRYRSCSWGKTAALLFAQYIGLATMCFPAAYSELGWFSGILATFLVAALCLYTSLTLWRFCLRHPHVRDICDIGILLFGEKAWVRWATAIMFVANNIFVMGLHVVVGSEYLNTVTSTWSPSVCKTVLFSGIATIACWASSLPRTFKMLSHLATVSAVFTLISVALAAIFSVMQVYPANYREKLEPDSVANGSLAFGDPIFSPWPAPKATFVSTMVAFLNICYTFIGQITLPSYIAEMRNPSDFPKALWTCTAAQLVLFCAVGVTIYKYTGIQYMTSPAFGGLGPFQKIVSFSFMIPTIVILGAMYASITARFIFFRLFRESKHLYNHTVKGWSAWSGILLVIWVLGFIISQVIPFFSALLALVACIFDAFFGFIFWGVAWFKMRAEDKNAGVRKVNKELDRVLVLLNASIIGLGIFLFLIAGSIASVQFILQKFSAGAVSRSFTCESNAL